MDPRRIIPTAVFLIAAGLAAHAFEPVFVAGTDLEFAASATSTTNTTATRLRPRAALSWRDPLANGGFVAVTGRMAAAVPLHGGGGLSDQERFDVELGLPVADNELILGAGTESSFLTDGSLQSTIIPRWNADYRFMNDEGWFGVLSDGFYRWSSAGTDDALVQRFGVGYSSTASIRFGLGSDLLVGYELWPEYTLEDSSGATTNATRRDLTVQLDTTAEGLWGYFTSWSVSGIAASRFSNATRYLDAVGEFESDAESRVSGRLAASVRTSPIRQLGLAGSLAVHNLRYLGREARDESGASLGRRLSVLNVTATLDGDYNPADIDNLFFVSSVAVDAAFSPEAARRGWYVQARLGVEYSF